jgi:hypothetical protein
LKKAFIILTLILPMTCDAKVGWSFTDYSLLAGQQYRLGQRPLWSFEFQYDKFIRTCIGRTHYHGIGANYSFNNNQSELGIKFMYNPTSLKIIVSRSIKFYPYYLDKATSFRQNLKTQ